VSNATNCKKFVFFKIKYVLAIFMVFAVAACLLGAPASAKEPGPCDGIQWEHPNDRLKCLYPDPPIGRWKAVYTEAFAKNHDLPLENISTDLSSGVDYMEMDVQPYGNGGTACLVNMLIKRPNDVAVFNGFGKEWDWSSELHDRRRLSHFIDLDKHKGKIQRITTFGLSPRNMKYDPKKSYGMGSAFAYYAEDILAGYDYITANAGCYHLLSDTTRFPGGWAFDIAKASVWGRYKSNYGHVDSPYIPKKERFFNSLFQINIPHELISTVFRDMPIGGRH